ncbi:MAG: sigma-54-dependent Fis family transcriptional regulator [Verrucomicrobia bacterium]|nr:sigma-54-dependent Fis family transcriptional regulator [Verrucomicrobiota bacterium]
MATRAQVLIIDADVTTLEALRVGLAKNGFTVEAHADAHEAYRALAARPFDVVIASLGVPQAEGRKLLERVKQGDPTVPVIFLANGSACSSAVEALRQGAFDIVEGPIRVPKVRSLVERAIEVRRLREEVARLRAEMLAGTCPDELIGQSPPLVAVLEAIRRAAADTGCVLLCGAPGTGKELAARTIHRLSTRASKPFVAVDCAALNEAFVESELFGHVRGAFPGAFADHASLIETADGGTLFLNSIDVLSKAAQVRLLKVIDERVIRPLGSTASRPVEARLVAGTATDPATAAGRRRVREDLLARLSTVRIALPELKERSEDIPLLANFFAKTMGARLGTPPPAISPKAMAILMDRPWPGNVRQLRDVVERAALLTDSAQICPEHLGEPT